MSDAFECFRRGNTFTVTINFGYWICHFIYPRFNSFLYLLHCISFCFKPSFQSPHFVKKISRRSGRLRRLVVSNHIIVSIAQKTTEARGRQRCFWVLQRNFCPCFANKPNIMADFNRRANLVACYLLILSILRRKQAISSTKIQHHVQNLMERTFSFSDVAHSRFEHFFFRLQQRPCRISSRFN